jgi:myo-inositol-1(or 4)-monophosphatase
MSKPNPSDLAPDVITIVRDAGKLLLPHYGTAASSSKGTTGHAVKDIVTALDISTEQYLCQELAKLAPTIGFRGEETGHHGNNTTFWLVDPIDGTSHFTRGLPFCTTMLALVDRGEVVFGVIHDFVNSSTYWAVRGQGAYCNDQPIKVSTRPLQVAMLAAELALVTPRQIDRLLDLRAAAGNLVDTLNSGFELAAVASGKLDGRVCIDGYGSDWDYAAGSLLVSEAGGTVTNIGVTTYDYRNHDFLMANPVVHHALTHGRQPLFPVG